MPGFDNGSTIDYMGDPWWNTISGAGTDSPAAASWADDYTRHRSGDIMDTTYSGVDTIIGRRDSIQDVNP